MLLKAVLLQELAFQLGRHVVVMNCSEGITQQRTARIMLGAAQSGAWALFDNINCLPAPVLSVFAADVGCLLLVCTCYVYAHVNCGAMFLLCTGRSTCRQPRAHHCPCALSSSATQRRRVA